MAFLSSGSQGSSRLLKNRVLLHFCADLRLIFVQTRRRNSLTSFSTFLPRSCSTSGEPSLNNCIKVESELSTRAESLLARDSSNSGSSGGSSRDCTSEGMRDRRCPRIKSIFSFIVPKLSYFLVIVVKNVLISRLDLVLSSMTTFSFGSVSANSRCG